MIDKYVANTHASTHRHYSLQIEEVPCSSFYVAICMVVLKRCVENVWTSFGSYIRYFKKE